MRKLLPMPCGRHRVSLDQVLEFDRGRIVANRDFGLSFREIGQRVGRNQATSHTPGLALHTTVAGKCPSSPEDEQEKQGESRDR
ncbi:hypothetical protein TNCV_962431 [Trichonephila clavipes]|nr:hypothetical protein TNCV_962431 [Trichonephila clavipes]